VEELEEDLRNNLYKIWNRMSSGSYFPKAVRLKEISKKDGGKRELGIPTVTDRVAQTIAAQELTQEVDRYFHEDSHGYRPGKSALEAVGKARERCWQYDYVIDLDIKGFFDELDHELLQQTVEKYTSKGWIRLYVKRWLKTPGQGKDGCERKRESGTPQGGVISPVLANLFLHEAYDVWMQEEFPRLPFERYADDIIVHCQTEKQARYVLRCIQSRLRKWKLRLHPEKTKIVRCQDQNRGGKKPQQKFEFLGYEFRPRKVRNNKTGQLFIGFTPAASPRALRNIRATIREWRLTQKTTMSLEEVAREINPVVRGWIQYYGAYNKSTLYPVIRQLEFGLAKWAMRKFKRLHRKLVRALRWLAGIARREPQLFAHWSIS
jgi:RNA-directed DNA polymerase